MTGGVFVFLLVTLRLVAPRRTMRAAAPVGRAAAEPGTPAQPDERALRARSADKAAQVAALAEMVEAAGTPARTTPR